MTTPLAVRNARFLPDYPYSTVALLRDLREGLRYEQDDRDKVLPWNTTFAELDTLPFVERTLHDRFGWPVYRFDVPLLLGILEVNGLQINVPNPVHQPDWRFDMPLDHFPFEVRLENDGVENYWLLKEYFQVALGTPVRLWEREDQLHAEWNSDGLEISLTYWLRSYLDQGESGFASLNIRNERIFPQYFTDDYVTNFNLEAPGVVRATFDLPNCTISHHYRYSQWVRFTPESVRQVLQKKQQSLAVWYDPAAEKMGFAKDEQFCKVVQLHDQQQFILQLIDHDRGHYSHELQVKHVTGRTETVLNGAVNSLDAVVEWLEQNGFQVLRQD